MMIVSVIKHVKFPEYLDTKNCSCKKHLFGKLVLACEDEMLNTIETTIVEKKAIYEKNNCLIHTISLINICLFSLVCISISCHYYLRNKDVLSYQWKMNSVKEINIKNRTNYFLNNMINIKNLNPEKIKIDEKPYKNIRTR